MERIVLEIFWLRVYHYTYLLGFPTIVSYTVLYYLTLVSRGILWNVLLIGNQRRDRSGPLAAAATGDIRKSQKKLK